MPAAVETATNPNLKTETNPLCSETELLTLILTAVFAEQDITGKENYTEPIQLVAQTTKRQKA